MNLMSSNAAYYADLSNIRSTRLGKGYKAELARRSGSEFVPDVYLNSDVHRAQYKLIRK